MVDKSKAKAGLDADTKANVTLFKPWETCVSSELTETLFSMATTQHYSDGQRIYNVGDATAGMYGVSKGMVKIIFNSERGLTGTLGIYPIDNWFGENSVFENVSLPTEAIAVGEAEIAFVTREQFIDLLDANPIWYKDIARVMSFKLRMSLHHIESIFYSINVRVILRLLDLGRSFGKSVGEGILIDLKLPQDDLAAMLGLARQTVNKELSVLSKQQLISISRGTITLLDEEGLKQSVRDQGGQTLLGD